MNKGKHAISLQRHQEAMQILPKCNCGARIALLKAGIQCHQSAVMIAYFTAAHTNDD